MPARLFRRAQRCNPGIVMASLVILFFRTPSSHDSQNSYYVSPSGTGDLCSIDQPCSLTAAHDRLRRENDDMSDDVTVYLRDGRYALEAPLVFNEDDSATNDYNIVYTSYPGETPVFSGGRTVSNWRLHDAARGIYAAQVGANLQTRQLYVNGRRAVRARGETDPPGWHKTGNGYLAPNPDLAGWQRPDAVEIVSFTEWKSFRCGVAAVAGREVVMDEPCWTNALLHEAFPIGLPKWLENAYELLDEAREWYLDTPSGTLYYIPAPDEDLGEAEVIVPVLEALVIGDNVRNIHFRGITFAYTTWLRPSTSVGYAVLQAGWSLTGEGDASRRWVPARTPGAVAFRDARALRFEGNYFVHLGSVGLDLSGASQDNVIERNVFEDISSTGIQLGQVGDFNIGIEPRKVKNNRIANNFLTRVGAEYFDAVAVFLGYTDSTTVVHNEIYDTPYTGISAGWGWGQLSYARANQIAYNHIHKIMQVMSDGGGVYTLSPQPDSVIHGNYIHDMKNPYGGLYLDEGSRYFTVTNNVVADVPRWLHIWTTTIRDNVVRNNCTDTFLKLNAGTNNDVSENQEGLRSWPPDCQAVIDQAGIEGGREALTASPG